MRGNYSEIVRSRLDRILRDDGSGGDLEKYQACQLTLGQLIEEIRTEVLADPFGDAVEEIRFYKEEAPGIWGQYYFYNNLVKFEARRRFQSKEVFVSGLYRLLKQTEDFLARRSRICEYYYTGRTDADERLFTRHGTHGAADLTSDMFIDRDFTKGAHRLSRVRACELLRDWLTTELQELPEPGRTKKLEWNATATATIELFKALHLDGCFGDMSFKEVMGWVREVLGADVGNYNIVLQNARDRKITTAKFLEKLGKEFKSFIDSKK